MSARLRLGVVNLTLDPWRGGMDAALFALLSELRKTCEITLFAATAEASALLEGVQVRLLPSIPIYRGQLRFWTFKAAWALYRRLTGVERRFDIVYGTSALFGGVHVSAVHFNSGAWLRELRRYGPNGKSLRHRLIHIYQRWNHAFAAAIERRTYRQIGRRDHVRLLPVSVDLLKSLAEEYGLEPEGIEVVTNPLDTQRFHSGRDLDLRCELADRMGWSPDDFISLFVGGNWARKGLRSALAALALLPMSTRLIVVGIGDPRLFADQLKEPGMAGRVHFAGPRRDVERFYRAVDAFVFPSRYETQGLVCMEALASGLPVVVTRFPGASSLVREGETGFLVDDPVEIADRLTRLMHDGALRKRMGNLATRSMEAYSKSAVAERVRRLLEDEAQRLSNRRRALRGQG